MGWLHCICDRGCSWTVVIQCLMVRTATVQGEVLAAAGGASLGSSGAAKAEASKKVSWGAFVKSGEAASVGIIDQLGHSAGVEPSAE